MQREIADRVNDLTKLFLSAGLPYLLTLLPAPKTAPNCGMT